MQKWTAHEGFDSIATPSANENFSLKIRFRATNQITRYIQPMSSFTNSANLLYEKTLEFKEVTAPFTYNSRWYAMIIEGLEMIQDLNTP